MKNPKTFQLLQFQPHNKMASMKALCGLHFRKEQWHREQHGLCYKAPERAGNKLKKEVLVKNDYTEAKL